MKKNFDQLKNHEFISECPDKFSQIIVEKTDLDTIGSFFLHQKADRVDANTPIKSVRGQAGPEDLTDQNTLCIECGGSGQTNLGNFDHHDHDGPDISATWQTYLTLKPAQKNYFLEHVCHYIDNIDRLSPQQISQKYPSTCFPSLSDIISGINLKHSRQPEIALKEGAKVIQHLLTKEEMPTGPVSGFEEYAQLKKQNNDQIESVRQNIIFVESQNNTYIGHLETTFFGAPGIIYEEGLKKFGPETTVIAVAHNPNFGPAKNENKFTIGLNLSPEQANMKNISLKKLAEQLNRTANDPSVNLDEGKSWGGPPTGTIIGSPKGGTGLNMSQVLDTILAVY